MTEILIILLLILLNGIFAMSEIAMVSSRKARLEKAARRGDRMAKKALQLSQNPGKFLSTVQIGITLIGILTGIYSGEKIEDDLRNYLNGFEWLRPYSQTLSVTIIVVILTFFSLVLGELVPKRIGLTMPESIARVLSYPMYLISVIAAPFIWMLTSSTEMLIRVFNIRKTKDSYVTEDEIKAIVQEGAEAGTVQEIEQDIVENVFHLGDRKIITLMTPRPDIVWININDDPGKIKTMISGSPHKSFPVCQGDLDNVIGVVHAKEMLNYILSNEIFDVEKAISTPLFLIESTSAYRALEKFRGSKQRVAMVVDEFGSIQGILTMNDLIDALVGDLAEQLHEKKEIIPREDGSFLVDAGLSLPEFARYFDIDIADDETMTGINTVGGLVFHFEKKIPKAGDKFQWKSLRMEIVDMDGRRVDKIMVIKEVKRG